MWANRVVVRRSFFTNGKRIHAEDPYRILGLEWGATATEIKQAYRLQAAQLHPDVNPHDAAATAKFQRLTKAYKSLTNNNPGVDTTDDDVNWRLSIWRKGDRLATERTDVAGQLRRRPIPPAQLKKDVNRFTLGNNSNVGGRRRGEYLGETTVSVSSSVGRGRSKWVSPKPYVAWDAASETDDRETK